MMRQKLAFVVTGPPLAALSRMNGFSPVRMTRFGSAAMVHLPLAKTVVPPIVQEFCCLTHAKGVPMSSNRLAACIVAALSLAALGPAARAEEPINVENWPDMFRATS